MIQIIFSKDEFRPVFRDDDLVLFLFFVFLAYFLPTCLYFSTLYQMNYDLILF